MPPLPKTIFKYEEFNVRSLQNLKAQSVYFASPSQFNDPYDCTITAQIAEPTSHEIELMRRSLVDRPNVSGNVRWLFGSQSQDDLKALLMRNLSQVFQDERTKFLKQRGVCCFSEVNDDLLMWAHYGGRYQGYCLEFRTDYAPFNGLRAVKYVEEIPTINLVPFVVDKDAIQWVDLYCTKSRAWAYEREWRAIHLETGTLFGYEASALKGVYFGPNMDRQTLEIICLVLQGQNSDVEFWQGKQSDKALKIEFESLGSYTTHIVAKQRGLV